MDKPQLIKDMRRALFVILYLIGKFPFSFSLLLSYYIVLVVILTVSCTLPSSSETYHCILVNMRMILKHKKLLRRSIRLFL